MDRKNVHKGLFGSIGLHLVIMLIPLSTTVDWKLDEIELFVLDERPVIKKDMIERPKIPTLPKAPHKEVRKEPILPPMPPVTEEERPVNQTLIEPPITFPEPIPEAPPESQAAPLSQMVVPVLETKTIETAEPFTAPPNTLEAPTESQTSALKQSPTTLEDVPFGTEVAPKFLRREMPIYPLLARKLGKEGKVLLRLTIDERGNLLGVDVIGRGDYGFTEAALEAVRKSTFLPAKKGGKSIASRALLPVRFRLERN